MFWINLIFSVPDVVSSLLCNTDGIRRTGSVWGRRRGRGSEGGSRIAVRRSATPQVLHGAVSGDVQLTELTSGQPLFTLGQCLTALLTISGKAGLLLVIQVLA